MTEQAVTVWSPPPGGIGFVAPEPWWAARWLGLPDGKGFSKAASQALAGDENLTRDVKALAARYRISWPAAGKLVEGLCAALAGGLSVADYRGGAAARLRAICDDVGVAGVLLSEALAARSRVLYGEAVEAATSDGEVSDAEAAELKAIREGLALPEPEAVAIYAATVNALFNARLKGLLDDGMLSPDEDAELADLFVKLKVKTTFEAATVTVLNDARKAWAINHGALPEIAVPVSLQRNEVAYAVVDADCYERRTRTRSVGYAGPAVRIKIAKGLSYRAGNYRVSRQVEEYSHLLGSGPLVVTSKRLIFAGDRRAISPRLDSILQIEGYVDGLEILRGTGKPMLFQFKSENPWFAAILQRARRDA